MSGIFNRSRTSSSSSTSSNSSTSSESTSSSSSNRGLPPVFSATKYLPPEKVSPLPMPKLEQIQSFSKSPDKESEHEAKEAADDDTIIVIDDEEDYCFMCQEAGHKVGPDCVICKQCGKSGHLRKHCTELTLTTSKEKDDKAKSKEGPVVMVDIDDESDDEGIETIKFVNKEKGVHHGLPSQCAGPLRRPVASIFSNIEYKCAICTNLMVDAVDLPCCGAGVCQACVPRAIVDNVGSVIDDEQICSLCQVPGIMAQDVVPSIRTRKAIADSEQRKNEIQKQSNDLDQESSSTRKRKASDNITIDEECNKVAKILHRFASQGSQTMSKCDCEEQDNSKNCYLCRTLPVTAAEDVLLKPTKGNDNAVSFLAKVSEMESFYSSKRYVRVVPKINVKSNFHPDKDKFLALKSGVHKLVGKNYIFVSVNIQVATVVKIARGAVVGVVTCIDEREELENDRLYDIDFKLSPAKLLHREETPLSILPDKPHSVNVSLGNHLFPLSVGCQNFLVSVKSELPSLNILGRRFTLESDSSHLKLTLVNVTSSPVQLRHEQVVGTVESLMTQAYVEKILKDAACQSIDILSDSDEDDDEGIEIVGSTSSCSRLPSFTSASSGLPSIASSSSGLPSVASSSSGLPSVAEPTSIDNMLAIGDDILFSLDECATEALDAIATVEKDAASKDDNVELPKTFTSVHLNNFINSEDFGGQPELMPNQSSVLDNWNVATRDTFLKSSVGVSNFGASASDLWTIDNSFRWLNSTVDPAMCFDMNPPPCSNPGLFADINHLSSYSNSGTCLDLSSSNPGYYSHSNLGPYVDNNTPSNHTSVITENTHAQTSQLEMENDLGREDVKTIEDGKLKNSLSDVDGLGEYTIIALQIETIQENNRSEKDITQIGCSALEYFTHAQTNFLKVIKPPRIKNYLSMKMKGDLLKYLNIQENDQGEFEFRKPFEIVKNKSDIIKCTSENIALDSLRQFLLQFKNPILLSLDGSSVKLILEKLKEVGQDEMVNSYIKGFCSWKSFLQGAHRSNAEITMEFEEFVEMTGITIPAKPNTLDISMMLINAVEFVKSTSHIQNLNTFMPQISIPINMIPTQASQSKSGMDTNSPPEFLEICNNWKLSAQIQVEHIDTLDISDSDDD